MPYPMAAIQAAVMGHTRVGTVYTPADVLCDTFTDADSTAITAHTPEAGVGWTQAAGTWYIQSNTLTPNSFTDGNIVVAPAIANGTLTVDVTPTDNGTSDNQCGVLFRYSNATNFWLANVNSRTNQFILYKCVNNSFTAVVTQSSLTIESGTTYTVTIILDGSSISAQLGSNSPATTTDTFNLGATWVGARLGKFGTYATKPTWDNLCFTNDDIPVARPLFTRYVSNPIVAKGAGGTWEDVDVANPDIFWDTPNSRWVMNYSGYDGALWHTGLAYSTDLTTWTKDENNPVFSPNAGEESIAANGSIVLLDSTYYLYYQGKNTPRIYCATSSDLATWTRANSGNPVIDVGTVGAWDDAYTFDPMARLNGDTVELYYCASSGTERNLGWATSTDGVTFTKQGMIATTGKPPTIDGNFGEPFVSMVSGTKFALTFDAATVSNDRRIDCAVTYDGGASFIYFEGVLAGSGTGWDTEQVFDSCIVESSGTVYLFYAGATLTGGGAGMSAQIGLATATWSIG